MDRALTSLVVTSSNPGEGKSTVAANLAIVMAQSGRSVVLVDADLRRPVQHKYFDLNASPGLTDVLIQPDASPWPFVREVLPNLYILTSGGRPPNPAELLGSQRMQQLTVELSAKTDLIIFDAPPVLAVTDACILGRLADGALLVFDVNTTTRSAARHTVTSLRQVGVNLLGVVANRVSTSSHYFYSYAKSHYYDMHENEQGGQGTTAISPDGRVSEQPAAIPVVGSESQSR